MISSTVKLPEPSLSKAWNASTAVLIFSHICLLSSAIFFSVRGEGRRLSPSKSLLLESTDDDGPEGDDGIEAPSDEGWCDTRLCIWAESWCETPWCERSEGDAA